MTRHPRRAGRPKLTDLNRRRWRIRLNLTFQEMTLLRCRASLASVPVHVLVRELALYSRVNTPAVPRANFAVVGRLGRIGNAVNQAVKKVNAGQLAPELRPLLEDLLHLLRELRNVLVVPE